MTHCCAAPLCTKGIKGTAEFCKAHQHYALVEPTGALRCPVCAGEGEALGTLGRTTHYRCRACGSNFVAE
jgi:transposase-like protein